MSEIAETLTKAGVGRLYHDKHLAQFGPTGESLAAWITGGEAKEELSQGLGLCLHGPSLVARELAIVAAKGLILTGRDAQVVTLSALSRMLGGSLPEDVEACEALFVLDFFVTGYEACPLTPSQRHVVEDYILERYDNGNSVSVHTMALPDSMKWWTPLFVKRVSSQTKLISV